MMAWNDDSWRDGYDAWKLRSPDDEYDEPECHHEAFDIDIEGRAHCDRCGETWHASGEEIAFQREQQAEYDAWCRKQVRREFWRKVTFPIRWPIYGLLEVIWPRRAIDVLYDEEVPF